MSHDATFRTLCEDYWESILDASPAIASSVGDTRHDRTLSNQSIETHEHTNRVHRRLLHKLGTIDVKRLDSKNQQHYELLKRELELSLQSFTLDRHLRPQLYPITPDMWFGLTLKQTSIFSKEDAENYIAKLEQMPKAIDEQITCLRAGLAKGYSVPRVLISRIAESAKAQLDLPAAQTIWFSALAGKPVNTYGDIQKSARATIKEDVNGALESWLDFLCSEYAAAATDSISLANQPNGESYYRFLVRSETLSDMAPEDIHKVGKSEVLRIQGEMEQVATRAGFPNDLQGLRDHMKQDGDFVATSAEELKKQFEIVAMRINRLIPEWFSHLPRMTYGVESISEKASPSSPPAFAQANPVTNTSAGIHWVTSLPEKCPSYMQIPLSLHEAWPGHLMHIALMQEQDELPAFRRNGALNYNAYLEGWALYCEKLGHKMGLYEDPIDHYGQLDMEMWRACRLVVDTGIHLYAWTREQAIDYMTEHATIPLQTIEAEVDRYIGYPAQALSYKVGELKILSLVQRAEDELGDQFSLRDLHTQLIGCGPTTLDLMAEHVFSWIDATRASAPAGS